MAPTEPLKYVSVSELVAKCLGRDFEVTSDKRDYFMYALLKEVHEINQRLKILTKDAAIPYEKDIREVLKAKDKAIKEAQEKAQALADEIKRNERIKTLSKISSKTSRSNLNKVAKANGIDHCKYSNRKKLYKAIKDYLKEL